jgi:dolichol kinase
LALFAGLVAIAAAVTGGRIGLFRPDVSFRGAADVLGVASSVVLACVVLFDLADVAYGAFVALVAAVAVMGLSGDYRVLRGAPSFPSLTRGADEPAP